MIWHITQRGASYRVWPRENRKDNGIACTHTHTYNTTQMHNNVHVSHVREIRLWRRQGNRSGAHVQPRLIFGFRGYVLGACRADAVYLHATLQRRKARTTRTFDSVCANVLHSLHSASRHSA